MSISMMFLLDWYYCCGRWLCGAIRPRSLSGCLKGLMIRFARH